MTDLLSIGARAPEFCFPVTPEALRREPTVRIPQSSAPRNPSQCGTRFLNGQRHDDTLDYEALAGAVRQQIETMEGNKR